MVTRSLPSDRRMPLVYVALGDSTVYGLGASSPDTHYVARLFASLQWEYPAARLTNLGTCLAPRGDDLRRGRGPYDFARRVEVILERLDRETDAAVILNALPDLASAPRFRQGERSTVAALTRHYNHALRHVAEGFGVDLVDLEIGDGAESELRRFFSDDGYHPSDGGYAAWAGGLGDA